MEILERKYVEKDKIIHFLESQWGSRQMVISSGVFDCSELDGFAAMDDRGTICGLVTFIISGVECEIISLDSRIEGRGTGEALVNHVEKTAITKKCSFLKVITTNDNLNALRFYQKRGFILSKLFQNAIKQARKIKPEIPFYGYEGIPVRDEIKLVKVLM
ncbi:GNAT family N-acetyltransferase [Halobacillus rhizosphaerae]|uniref:GNAT family N-acetyltransferase n=1 Tax=Halobacillus rhizosphaerae TaxID=3064889 RepID=UPI00398ACA1F